MAIVIEGETIVALLTGAAGVGAGLALSFRRTTRLLKPLAFLLEDWNGVEKRPGVPGRDGVMVRLANIEERQAAVQQELTTNGGSSLRDEVAAISKRLAAVEKKVDRVLTVTTEGG